MDEDVNHRARLLERSIHKVLNERERGSNGETLEGGWGKFWLRMTGKRLLTVAVILMAVAAPTYLLWEHDRRSDNMLKNINSAVKESNELATAQLWLMSITEDERQKLNLSRPKKITEMQR